MTKVNDQIDNKGNLMRSIQILGKKKELNNLRIYHRDGPIVEEKPQSSFNRYLPQFLANFAINLMMADAGLALSYPTLVNGYIYSGNATYVNNGRDQFLQLGFFPRITFDKFQSSLYSSLQYLLIPVGCIAGGSVIDIFGRKKIIFAASVPLFASWLMNFFSQNVEMLYLANALSGLGIGFGESAIATYQGEVTEPAIRGTVINLAIMLLAVSFLGPFVIHLGVPSWRWTSLIFSAVPVIAAIVSLLVPESPVWLLSKGQVSLAEKSLKRLRGGVTKDEIDEEIRSINSYLYSSESHLNKFQTQLPSEDNLPKRDIFKEKWKYYLSDKIRRPFILSCVMFILVYLTGVSTMRLYLNIILEKIHYNGNWTHIGLTLTLAGVAGNVIGLAGIGFTGKRFAVLTALAINGLSSLIIAISIYERLIVSIKLISLHVMYFVTGYGIVPVPWILQSEIYPFRGRGVTAGCAAGLSYLIGFIATFVFLPIASLIEIQGTFILFSISSFTGLIFMYFQLPETEGRSLEQIEQFFKRK